MSKTTPRLPTPQIAQEEDGTWTLTVPGICVSGGHPAPEWAMAKAVETVQKAASDIVRTWIAGRPVTDEEKAVVLQVTRGDSRVYEWLGASLVDDDRGGKRR